MLGIKDNAAFLPVGVRQVLLGLVLCINWNLKRMGALLVMHLQMSLLHAFHTMYSGQGVSCAFKGWLLLLSSHLS